MTRAFPARRRRQQLLSLRGGLRARGRLLAWDENERFAYRVEELNMPGVRAFVEEWTLAPGHPQDGGSALSGGRG